MIRSAFRVRRWSAGGSPAGPRAAGPRRSYYRGEITTAVEMLLNHQQLTLQDADVVVAALDHYRGKPSVGFSDCLVLEIARKAGHVQLATFDRSLGKLVGVELL